MVPAASAALTTSTESAAANPAIGESAVPRAAAAKVPEGVSGEVAAIATVVSVSDVVPQTVVTEPGNTASDKPSQTVVMAPAAQAIASEREYLSLVDPEVYRLQQETLLKLYRSSIIKRALHQVKYPRSAVRRGYQGTVVLELTVNRSGEVLSLGQTSTTRYKSLDAAAAAAVENAGNLPPVPAGLDGARVVVSIPLTSYPLPPHPL